MPLDLWLPALQPLFVSYAKLLMPTAFALYVWIMMPLGHPTHPGVKWELLGGWTLYIVPGKYYYPTKYPYREEWRILVYLTTRGEYSYWEEWRISVYSTTRGGYFFLFLFCLPCPTHICCLRNPNVVLSKHILQNIREGV